MSILNAPFFNYASRLVDIAQPEHREEAEELKQKIAKEFLSEVDKKVDADARRRLFKVLRITYDGDLDWLKRDLAKIVLMDLDSTEGLDKVQRFLYAVWEQCFDEFGDSKEDLNKDLDMSW